MAEDSQNIDQPKQLLGEILRKRNLITVEQLNQALKVQQDQGGGYIGEILVRQGVIDERDVMVALIVQCNFPYIAIDKYEIEQSVLKLIPKEIALKHHVIALDRVGDMLSVVMADPLNMAMREELQRMTNCRIAPFIATKKEIEKTLERCFNQRS